jgi:hypothetical protein
MSSVALIFLQLAAPKQGRYAGRFEIALPRRTVSAVGTAHGHRRYQARRAP